jgi:hypothetical protein
MKKNLIITYPLLKNIFKIILFLTFIDLILFTIQRLLINYQFVKQEYIVYLISDFSLYNYLIFFFLSLVIFFLTILLTIFLPIINFRIYLSRNFLLLSSIILLPLSFYLFIVLLDFNPRYSPGTVKSIPSILHLINYSALLGLFIIYQLNRSELGLILFLIILLNLFLIIDGLAPILTLLSMILFNYFRKNLKNKIKMHFLVLIFFFLICIFSLILNLFENFLDFFYIFIIPRISTHSEQLYSYISGDLDISNFNYILNLIMESFNNRVKIIFNNDYNLFNPKTVSRSIVDSTQGLNAPGGSSPGYVLSVISFLPFTLVPVTILSIIIKQFCFRLNEKLNFIQVACLCFIFKAITADLLDMFSIISYSLIFLIVVFLSVYIYIKKEN